MAGSCEFDTYLTEIGFKITNSLNKKVQHFLHIFGNLSVKDKNIGFDLKFSILKLSRSYSKEAKVRDLCQTEKIYIMFHNIYLASDHTHHTFPHLIGGLKYYRNVGIGPKTYLTIGHSRYW